MASNGDRPGRINFATSDPSLSDMVQGLNALSDQVQGLLTGKTGKSIRLGAGMRSPLNSSSEIILESTGGRGGPSRGALKYVWTPFSGDEGAIRIRTGVVNGTYLPTNAASEFTLAGTGTTYFWLQANLIAGALISVEYDYGTEAPEQPEAEEGVHPTVVYQLLFSIDHEDGVVDLASVNQFVWQSLGLANFVREISGTAPDFDVTYHMLFLINSSS